MSQDSPSFGLPRSERAEFIRRIQELEERCRRAEDALRTLEDQNRLLGDSAPFGIIVIETEGRVYGANQKMLKMLAWPSDQDVTELNLLQYPPLVDSGVADSFRLCLEKQTRIVSDHLCQQISEGCEHLRYHNDFVVVLPGFDQAQALEQAKKIKARIENHVFLRDQGFEVRIRSSFGIASYPLHADDMTDLLATADHALFGAKASEKGTIKSAPIGS